MSEADLPDYRCPDGHLIPERRFDRKLGCVILTCAYRHRTRPKLDRIDEGEREAERMRAERLALRGLAGMRAAAPVDEAEPALMSAWPADLSAEHLDGAEMVLVEPPPRHPDAVRSDRLLQVVERVEALFDQRAEVNSIVRDVLDFAKLTGFEPKAIRAVIRMRAEEPEKRKGFEASVEAYRAALGIDGPDTVVLLPLAAKVAPAAAGGATEADPQETKALKSRRAQIALAELAQRAREAI